MLEKFITENDSGMMGRMAFFMTTLTDEIAEEMAELDELQIRLFMFQIGEVISWIGHGDNERLPENIRPFAEMVQPSANTGEPEDASTHLELDSQSR